MIDQATTLARIYEYLLSDQWGFNNLAKNQNADPDRFTRRDRLLTDEAEKPRSFTIISEPEGEK